ncbi:MAG: hypothetical protein ABW192_00175 [Sphingobium sp.]
MPHPAPVPPLRLRIHVSEPFDFERENAESDFLGMTVDHQDADSDEWEVVLEGSFQFNEVEYDRVLLGPRYMGEHLGKVYDAFLGVPVRIAHRTHSEVDGEGWHFALTGMISLAPPPPEPDNGSVIDGPDETTES